MTETDLAEATAGVHAVVPILGAMGLEVLEATPGSAAARIPSGPNVNHFGVAYAGSLFSVAEMLGGIIGGFFDVSGAVPLVKRLEIDFTRPAMTAATARTTLSEEERARVQAEATENGKSNFELLTEVTDEDGTVVAKTHGFYQLRVMG
ncbi:acyl-coenzyme A thioesterase PaaI-like protein [Marmoricola sp. OAE513]|uniref:PaaI family thioesterase n=1 Tax=Marmoricola sp. OAE513 TaxID=2817894 RepID=UPI001AE2F766